MTQKPEKQFNSRTYRGQVERELILGAILITLIVGGGLIALIWGCDAFFTAFAFFIGALLLAGLVWGSLKVLEIISRD
jgi:small-conductance mechanosensitive channel